MALKINFKDFKAQFPFRFTAKTTREEANKLLSGIEANMDILPNFAVEEGTEVNSAFFRQLEKDINADQVRQDEAFQLAIENIEVPVTSVNDETGAVVLTASDVGASPIGHGHVYSDISGKPSTFPPSSHAHTPTQVGLGSVQNYGIATTAEAQAGASNTKYMTPFLVKQAVQYLATTGGISMIKSVQRGVSVGNSVDFSIGISAINPAKAVVLFDTEEIGTSTASAGQILYAPILLSITATAINITKSAKTHSNDTTAKRFAWQVIEYV